MIVYEVEATWKNFTPVKLAVVDLRWIINTKATDVCTNFLPDGSINGIKYKDEKIMTETGACKYVELKRTEPHAFTLQNNVTFSRYYKCTTQGSSNQQTAAEEDANCAFRRQTTLRAARRLQEKTAGPLVE